MIDLGVVGGDGGAERHPGRPRLWRGVAGVALAVLVATMLVASGTVPPGFAKLLWSAEVGPGLLNLGTETVYIGEASEDGGLAALRLDNGARRWRLSLGEPAYEMSENGQGQVVVVSGFSGGRSTLLATSVDVASGRRLNAAAGMPLGRTADGSIYVLDATGPEGTLGSGQLLAAFRPAGGELAWSRRLPVAGQVWLDRYPDGSARWVITITASGAVDVWHPNTGAPAGSGKVPISRRPYGPALGPISAVVGGRLLAVYDSPSGLTVSAYALPGMAYQWDAILLPGSDVGTSYAFGGCGDLLCVRRSGATEVVDPESGRIMVSTPGDVLGRLAGGLIAVVRFVNGGGESLVFDPRTGRQLGQYPGWVVSEWPVTGGALLYRAARDRMSFARVDETGALRPLGDVFGRDLVCRARDEVLACLDGRGKLRVWRLRLGS